MFSGIVECVGCVRALQREGSNLHITLSCPFAHELTIDQSVAHNGVCLTVVDLSREGMYTVTAIEETLLKSNLGRLKEGDLVNLERSMRLDARLDGHIVQGHVDQTATCTQVETKDGSWVYTFRYEPRPGAITVEKGYITVNGVSLTVVNSQPDGFQVAIIPYTHDNTNFQAIEPGTQVNLEFDIVGKYIARLLDAYRGA